ncbi:MAG: hypothetical protein AAFY63_00720 [Cyanobacteria bacterium J06643_13]
MKYRIFHYESMFNEDFLNYVCALTARDLMAIARSQTIIERSIVLYCRILS